MELSRANRKKIVIKNNTFSNGDTCIRIKGMNKRKGSIDELNVYIEDNEFNSVQGDGIYVDRIHPGRMRVAKNKFSTFNTVAMRVVESRASKEDIMIDENMFTSIYQIGVCVDSSVVSLTKNSFSSSVCGISVFLQASAGVSNFTQRAEEILDSHRDIYYRDTICKESFIGVSQTHLQVNASILGDAQAPAYPCRVIMKANKFKEISKSGIIIQNNSSGSIKVEDCTFVKAKEPVVINEKDDFFSKHNSPKNILMHDNSVLCAPFVGTPRTAMKGTIVVKNNKYDGAQSCVVSKHVNSYLYDINNTPVDHH